MNQTQKDPKNAFLLEAFNASNIHAEHKGGVWHCLPFDNEPPEISLSGLRSLMAVAPQERNALRAFLVECLSQPYGVRINAFAYYIGIKIKGVNA